jgi:hypothetical protein
VRRINRSRHTEGKILEEELMLGSEYRLALVKHGRIRGRDSLLFEARTSQSQLGRAAVLYRKRDSCIPISS